MITEYTRFQGDVGFEQHIDRLVDMSRYLQKKIEERDGFEFVMKEVTRPVRWWTRSDSLSCFLSFLYTHPGSGQRGCIPGGPLDQPLTPPPILVPFCCSRGSSTCVSGTCRAVCGRCPRGRTATSSSPRSVQPCSFPSLHLFVCRYQRSHMNLDARPKNSHGPHVCLQPACLKQSPE